MTFTDPADAIASLVSVPVPTFDTANEFREWAIATISKRIDDLLGKYAPEHDDEIGEMNDWREAVKFATNALLIEWAAKLEKYSETVLG